MTDWTPPSTDQPEKQDTNEAASLLGYYNFELDRYTIHQLVYHWVQQFPAHWVRLAIIEAVYQGRYKSISVEQILNLWKRRGQPRYHFNHEFERIVCNKLPQVPDVHQPVSDAAASLNRVSNQGYSPYSTRRHLSEPINLQSPTWHSNALPPPPELMSLKEALDTEEVAADSELEGRSAIAPTSSKSQPGVLPISFKIHTDRTENKPAPKSAPPGERASAKPSPILPRLEHTIPRQPSDEIIPDFIPESEASEFYSKLKAVAHPSSEPAVIEPAVIEPSVIEPAIAPTPNQNHEAMQAELTEPLAAETASQSNEPVEPFTHADP